MAALKNIPAARPSAAPKGRKGWMVPWSYPLRNMIVRWQASLFSALGIAMTIAVLCGVFALRNGFAALHSQTALDDAVVYLRMGATSEGESGITVENVEAFKTRPEVALDAKGAPLAAGESYLALFLEKEDAEGSLVNVPLRGVEAASFAIQGDLLRIVEGRNLTFGSDEIIVGRPLVGRIRGCRLGEDLVVNTTPFRVVGIFEHSGVYRGEIWGDVERMAAALERPVRQRVIAKVKPGTDIALLTKTLESDKRLPSQAQSEQSYFESQTSMLDGVLGILGNLLAGILGIAAVLGAANTMLAAVGARTHEVGVLRSLGFGRMAILLSFLVEAALIGLAGGLIGALIVLPLDGLQTGTMNWNTFTETAFSFRVDAKLLLTAITIAVTLGLVGGFIPAWRASRLEPVDAMRRR
jgi:ABC-type lipoprotein release transport system permease subunit